MMQAWKDRSTAPGVLLAVPFDRPEQIDPYTMANGNDPKIRARAKYAERDGRGCLRIACPADCADTNSAAWVRPIRPEWADGLHGLGTTPFWFQLQLRVNAGRLVPWLEGRGSWKYAIVANPLSSNLISLVLNTLPGNIPSAYIHNDHYGNGMPFQRFIPPYEYDLLPGWDRGEKYVGADRYCLYTDKSRRGCPRWPIDQWVTVMCRLHIRTYGGKAGNEFDYLWAPQGAREWETLISVRDFEAGNLRPNNPEGYSHIWLTTYETDRRAATGIEGEVCYRDLIVSTEEIAMPGDDVSDDLEFAIGGQVYVLVDDATATGDAAVTIGDRTMRVQPAPVDCQLSEWGAWYVAGEWTPCVDGMQYATEQRDRIVVTPPANGGAECGPLIEQRQVSRACVSSTSALATLAASMVPNSWAELVIPNADQVMGAGFNSARNRIVQACSAPWDTVAKQIHFAGGDHMQIPTPYYVYDEATGVFEERISPRPAANQHHADSCCVDPATGDFYVRQNSTGIVSRYRGGAWDNLPPTPENLNNVTFQALAFWSGQLAGIGHQGAVILYSGNFHTLNIFDVQSGSWLPKKTGMAPGAVNGVYSTCAQYSAQHQCLVYGGGNGQPKLFKMDAAGTVTDLGACPSQRKPGEQMLIGQLHGANMNLHPVTGDILIFGRGELWNLNPSTGVWTDLTDIAQPPMATVVTSTAINGVLDPHQPQRRCVVSASLPEHGAIAYFCAYYSKVVCWIWKP